MITYENARRHPAAFRNLFGCSIEAYDLLYAEFAAESERQIRQSAVTRKEAAPRKRKPGAGRRFKHPLRERLLLALFWLRAYPTLELLGLFFMLDKTSAEDNLKDTLATLSALPSFVLKPPGGQRKKLHTPQQARQVFPELALFLETGPPFVPRSENPAPPHSADGAPEIPEPDAAGSPTAGLEQLQKRGLTAGLIAPQIYCTAGVHFI